MAASASCADGNTIAVGAVSYSNSRVYMYGKPSAGWISGNETTQAVQSEGVLGDGFGAATALTAAGSLLVVGTPAAPARPEGGQGTTYVFGRIGGSAAGIGSALECGVRPADRRDAERAAGGDDDQRRHGSAERGQRCRQWAVHRNAELFHRVADRSGVRAALRV